MLEDDRVLLRIDVFRNVMREEVEYIDELPTIVWERLEELTGDEEVSSADLRSQALQSATASQAFIEHRVLRETKQLPWRNFTGDVRQNLRELKSCEYPSTDALTNKIWMLLRRGKQHV